MSICHGRDARRALNNLNFKINDPENLKIEIEKLLGLLISIITTVKAQSIQHYPLLRIGSV
jgi:hypothetical protein